MILLSLLASDNHLIVLPDIYVHLKSYRSYNRGQLLKGEMGSFRTGYVLEGCNYEVISWSYSYHV